MPEAGSLLVVEDNPRTGDLLSRWLRERGHTVTVCGDGKEAIALGGQGGFDLVLLDVGVPGADGFEVLSQLRGKHAATALPIVMATAHGHSDMVVRALELGANDYVTKPYDPAVLLARVQTQLALRRMNNELESANRRMRDDLQAAARIQEALLPAESTSLPGVRLAWSFRPCEDLAGDTLNVFALDADHVGLYLLDVAGHGVPAALLSVHLSLTLSPRDPTSVLVQPGDGSPVPPAEAVGALNRRFAWALTERYFTLFYGVLNRRTGELRYASAGHPGPALLTADGCRLLPPSGPPVGVLEVEYKEHVLRLLPGDRLYLYSDGVTEAESDGGGMYGKERLTELLLRERAAGLRQSLAALTAEVELWCGGRAGDDVSVLAVEFTG